MCNKGFQIKPLISHMTIANTKNSVYAKLNNKEFFSHKIYTKSF